MQLQMCSLRQNEEIVRYNFISWWLYCSEVKHFSSFSLPSPSLLYMNSNPMTMRLNEICKLWANLIISDIYHDIFIKLFKMCVILNTAISKQSCFNLEYEQKVIKFGYCHRCLLLLPPSHWLFLQEASCITSHLLTVPLSRGNPVVSDDIYA